MKIKISNKTFYKRHNSELIKFLNNQNTLHVINNSSRNKIKEDISDKIYLNPQEDNHNFQYNSDKKFNAIILTDIVESINDLSSFLDQMSNLLLPDGKLVISSINTKWISIVRLLEVLRLKDSSNNISYIHLKKIKKTVEAANLEFINSYSRQIIPFSLIGFGSFLNKVLESLFFFLNFGIKTYVVLRKVEPKKINYSKTIIIPAKNEEGNLLNLFKRIPNKNDFEIIFSCGESHDKTFDIVDKIKNENSDLIIKIHHQTKTGKANAVWEAVEKTTGDLIAILDSDLSVDPEVLPNFFEVLENNQADFVNGSRLVYQMEKGSMRFLNLIGNRAFQNLIGLIIKQQITDTLCGTKVFKRELVSKISWWSKEFKLYDPFGDFDLIFAAAFFSDKILEIPVHYRARVYGKTQISRFRDGYKLINYLIKSFFAFNSSKIVNI